MHDSWCKQEQILYLFYQEKYRITVLIQTAQLKGGQKVWYGTHNVNWYMINNKIG